MKNKKKIVQLIRTLNIGGCEMALLRMLPLTNDAFDNIIITLEKRGALAEKFEAVGIRVIEIKQKNLLDISGCFRLLKTLRTIKPDLIITNLLHADIAGRLFLQYFIPCKVVSSLVTTYNFKSYWPARIFERLTKYFSKGYMANAESVKKSYVENFKVSEKKITVVPSGMDIDFFASLKSDETIKKELGIQLSTFVIICVANLHPNKGHRYLLAAYEKLFEKQTDMRLLLIGEGGEKENLLRQASKYRSKNTIFFLGRRNDVPKLLALSDTFALATFFEGMSNAIMEAMASGLPIVTTDIPENRELVTHEINGLLCQVENSELLQKNLERLCLDRSFAKNLGKNAAQKMKAEYNLPDTAKRWKDFFRLMSKK